MSEWPMVVKGGVKLCSSPAHPGLRAPVTL